MFRFIALVLALLSFSCDPTNDYPQVELEEKVAAANWEGWYAAGLPDIDEDDCQTARFKVRFPEPWDFNMECYPATVDTAYACMVWDYLEYHTDGLRKTVKFPVAVISPKMTEGSVIEGLAVHELMHGLVYCTLPRHWTDRYDYRHTDERVWKGYEGDSAEDLARAALESM